MPVIRPIRELQNTTEISHFAKTLNEPIFITKNGRNDLVLMNDAVYERIMAQNEMYRKLAAAEAEVADGAELLDGMEVLKELRGKYVPFTRFFIKYKYSSLQAVPICISSFAESVTSVFRFAPVKSAICIFGNAFW